MSQSGRVSSLKSKKSSKDRDREKRNYFAGNFDNNSLTTNEKSSPTRESHSKRYAGLSSENIKVAAEQVPITESVPKLYSKESLEVLAEDLNYKLRYIIHQAANRAIISNRNAINSNDVEETFNDLSLGKFYGATSDPVWIPFSDHNHLYLCLGDPKIDILEETERELAYSQPSEPSIMKSWLTEYNKPNKYLVNYFKIISEEVISNDFELRKMALQNISSNPNIGPIIEWLYRFGYLLLMKDVTYDSLTLYALDLIETLEMSPLGNTEVSENQLKLLVRLILQRLLKSFTSLDRLKPLCWVLAILCRRYPLREFVITKLIHNVHELYKECSLQIVMIMNALGIDAIKNIFVTNIEYFFLVLQDSVSLYEYALMETYYILFKHGIYDMDLYSFHPAIESFKIMLQKSPKVINAGEKKEIDFISMKTKLIKTRRKIESKYIKKFVPYEELFEVPNFEIRMKQKLENHHRAMLNINWNKQSHITIGKNSVLLPVLKNKNIVLSIYYDHSLFSSNL